MDKLQDPPRPTLLVVDDDPVNLDVLGGLLRPLYDVLVATSGERALQIAASARKPDLILLDVMMPGMSGYETLIRLRDDPATCDIPVIFVSALCATEEEETGLELGAVDYITKPFRPPVVLARIHAHVELKRARDLLRDRAIQLEGEVSRRTAELAAALTAAEAANRAKSEFLANMMHEMHTPMNGILGMIGIALNEPGVPEDIRGHLAVAHDSAQALNAVLSEILDYAALVDGRGEPLCRPYSPSGLADEVAACFAAAAHAKGLALSCSSSPEVPAEAKGDEARLRRALTLLVDNAVKFTDAGMISVRVGAAPGWLAFHVADTGCGIPADRQEAVFAPFTQADASRTRRHGGAGLGLSIAQILVASMGGRIGVESEPGRGSVFHLSVPSECR